MAKARAAKAKGGQGPSIQIPAKLETGPLESGGVTPKTPADEGIDFFEGAIAPGETPISVYELRLDPDGGPSKELSVRRIFGVGRC
jgi:glycogen debranching enzyme